MRQQEAVIDAITLHEKINQPKTNMQSDVNERRSNCNCARLGGSLLVLGKPFCPCKGYSRKENRYKHQWEATKTSAGNQQKQKFKRIGNTEKRQCR